MSGPESITDAAALLHAFDQLTDELHERLAAALVHLEEINRAIAELRAQGVYPGVPIEQWQSPMRNGECGMANEKNDRKYLELIFRLTAPGSNFYQGPGGRRKVYIGAKAAAIATARDTVLRTDKCVRLEAAKAALEEWVRERQAEMCRVREGFEGYPQAAVRQLSLISNEE